MEKQKLPGKTSLLMLAVVFAAALLFTALIVVQNNSLRSLPFYLFLALAGIGLVLTLPNLWGWLAGTVTLFGWVLLKRYLGTWESINLLANALELSGMLVVFLLTGVFGSGLRAVLDACFSSLHRLAQLDVEDKHVGLIKPSVGKLRLVEEEERSVRYKRPFSLVVIQIQPNSARDFSASEMAFYLRVVANTMKSVTRKTDIPFLSASDQIALLLPETNLKGADRVVRNVMQRMRSAHFMEGGRTRIPLQERIQLRYGFAAFTGSSKDPIHMLEAAQRSLELAQAKEQHVFQNLTTRWELVGDTTEPIGSVADMLRATAHYIGVDQERADTVIEMGEGRPNGSPKRKVDLVLWQLTTLIREVRPDGHSRDGDGQVPAAYSDPGKLN
jgi:GGDEF domain-containing protein